jgi:uncharacterized membrane protein
MTIATSPAVASKRSSFQAKHAMWIVYGLMTLYVLLTRERSLLDAQSFFHQRYAPIKWLMFIHGIPAAVALILGVFQFSTKLRQRNLQLHRIMGRLYVGGVIIGAPLGMAVSRSLPPSGLFMASVIHATGWLLTTLTALYCVRTGNIQQHREWMIRSYPFAMVFIVARAVGQFPPIERIGDSAVNPVVWTTIAVACFLPSFIIEWQKLAKARRPARIPTQVRAVAAND